MKYIVYLTTNVNSEINGKKRIYIGVHKTENPEVFDGYIGNGIYITQPSTYMHPKTPFLYAVKKYGTASFKRITLFEFDDKESAYLKEAELVNIEFIKQSHTYNVYVGGICNNNGKTLYLFDLEGNLVKTWEYSIEAYEFYGYPASKFNAALNGKYSFLDSYWSHNDKIVLNDYLSTKHGQPTITYLYDINGKLIREFSSLKECAEAIGSNSNTLAKAIKTLCLTCKKYYVSTTLVDVFIPKPRKQWATYTYYVYDKDNNFYGNYLGKKVMPIINLHSWRSIKDIFLNLNGWYKDFYLSLTPVAIVPNKKLGHGNSISVDVYDKYGNFIETLDSVKSVKEKYKARSSDLKNIINGNKYFKEWIFKYHKL